MTTISAILDFLVQGLHTTAGWTILLTLVLLASVFGALREEQGK